MWNKPGWLLPDVEGPAPSLVGGCDVTTAAILGDCEVTFLLDDVWGLLLLKVYKYKNNLKNN